MTTRPPNRTEAARSRGRGRLASAWRTARWALFAGLVAGTFVLGYVGFSRYYEDLLAPRPATDLAYLTLQLFVLESGGISGPMPWQLEVARLLAPASTATAIAVTLATVFSDQLTGIRLRRSRRHVVVCGAGDQGSRLAMALLDAGHRVVVIDDDPWGSQLAELREGGALIVTGDARRADTLGRARVGDALAVVAFGDSDDVNAEVAIRAGELAATSRHPALTCLAHVRDPALCELLRSRQLAGGYGPGYRLDFFNVYEQGARVLLRDHPRAPAGPEAPRLAVVGLTPLGRALVVEAARQWCHADRRPGERASITIIDPGAEPAAHELEARYPQLSHAAEIRSVAPGTSYQDLRILSSGGPWDAVFVCVADPSRGLHVALQARQLLPDRSVNVVVELSRSPGMRELVEHTAMGKGLCAFDLHDATLRPELLLGGTYELLAQVIHEEYLASQVRNGTAAGNPSAVPWEALPDSLRESNRDQAAHIGVKLAAIGCGIAPLGDWDADQVRFSDAEVERLAEMEHQRWVDQRLRGGWTLGPKDVGGKASPYLVPWAQLADDIRELDRQTVRGIPAFLARAGYQVLRGPATERSEGTPGRSTR